MSRLSCFVAAASLVSACGSASSPTPVSIAPVVPTTPTATTTTTTTVPSGLPTVSITSGGMQPLEITISVGQRVLFVNNDVRPHDVVGGIDPSRPDCPEIVQMGFLTPGQRGETGVFMSAKTCEYHDHTQIGVPQFQGRIIIR